jgi:hypothetical protein
MIDDENINIMFQNVEGWRAFELKEGIGLAQASALRELPFDLDPERAPYAKELYWEGSILRAVITPTRDVLTADWLRYNIEPIIIMVAPSSVIDPDEVKYVTSHYEKVGRVNNTDEEQHGTVYHLSMNENEDEEDEGGLTRHSIVVTFIEHDAQVSFTFAAASAAEDSEIFDAVLKPLVQIANNFLKSPTLDILGASARAARSSTDMAFEYSLSGSFVSEGADVVHPLKGLDEGWSIYAHGGNEAIYSMLAVENLTDQPADLVERSRNRIFKLEPDDTGEVAFGWREDGAQLFVTPPVDIDAEGVSPLLLTITISSDFVVPAVSEDYDLIYQDDEPGGMQVMAFAPMQSVLSEEAERFDHSYIAVFNEINCSITAVCISTSEDEPKFYDDAFIQIALNVAEYVHGIAVDEDQS